MRQWVNDRVQLALAEQLLADAFWNGICMQRDDVDPATTYIEDSVQIGMDSVLLPGTHLLEKRRLVAKCRMDLQLQFTSQIGDSCIVRKFRSLESGVGEDVSMGPFSHCRS